MDEKARQFRAQILRGQELVLSAVEHIVEKVRVVDTELPALAELQEKVLAHLQYQYAQIMPWLEKRFEGEREISKQLEFLLFEIRELKIKSMAFFERYAGNLNAVDRRNFPVDFMQYRRAVIDRIHAEEEYLLPLLDKTG